MIGAWTEFGRLMIDAVAAALSLGNWWSITIFVHYGIP